MVGFAMLDFLFSTSLSLCIFVSLKKIGADSSEEAQKSTPVEDN